MNMELQAYLKIKQTSLADEMVRIKREYKKHSWAHNHNPKAEEKYQEHHKTYWGLRSHGATIVYTEVRATQLARAYFKGMPYARCEPNCRKGPDTFVRNRLYELVAKYENVVAYYQTNKRRQKDDVRKDIEAWITAPLENKEAA